MSDPFDTLGTLLDHVWARIERGARQSDDPMRLVALATAGGAGPQIRMVALRRANREAREIEIHSDRRTTKVDDLSCNPLGAVLLWDPEARLQIRIGATFTLCHAHAGRWDDVPAGARENYGTDPSPGTRISNATGFSRTPDLERFTALVGQVRSVDVVSLAHEPHRRAIFDASNRHGAWVAP